MTRSKKTSKKTTKAESPKLTEVELVPPTPQDMADGFNRYAKLITARAINPYVDRQGGCKELRKLYITYRQGVDSWRKLTKKYLDIDLPEPPMLNGDDYYKTIVRLAEWCVGVATKGLRSPLTKKARLIRDKLESLPEGEGMNRAEILNWLGQLDKPIYTDEGTFSKICKELRAYGLNNKPRIGYYFSKITS